MGIRAVNQAIGRVIRHKNDFGAILLCDRRFQNYTSDLSHWLNVHLQDDIRANFGNIVDELLEFFRNTEISYPTARFIDEDSAAVDFNTSVQSTSSSDSRDHKKMKFTTKKYISIQ